VISPHLPVLLILLGRLILRHHIFVAIRSSCKEIKKQRGSLRKLPNYCQSITFFEPLTKRGNPPDLKGQHAPEYPVFISRGSLYELFSKSL
jgi:hypothetical protein